MIIIFWHEIVSSFFCCYKFDVSMFSHIFHGFVKNRNIHQLKNIFWKSCLAFFLSSLLISMYGFNQIFWINLMSSWIFFKTNLWFTAYFNLCKFLRYFSARRQWKAKSKRVLYQQKHIACSYSYKLVCVEDKLVNFLKHT